ncbi:MAG: SEC-C metal-binding domain-containing protein [Rhabdochlamydiaceae bacterium]
MTKIGRNDPCSCGSGKKFKKCCELKAGSQKLKAHFVHAETDKTTDKTHKISSFFKKVSVGSVDSSIPAHEDNVSDKKSCE